MILYKNVDIKDLESILEKGILSLNESGNNNWDEGKRADNSCDMVYLFKPLTKENSFCNYGAALLEVDIPDNLAKENEINENDKNKGKYVEYVVDMVESELITKMYIPEIFKERIDVEFSEEVLSKIYWCEFKANYYGEGGRENCPAEVLEQFAKTAEIMDASEFNFFRGVTEERTMIDLYDVQYIWS